MPADPSRGTRQPRRNGGKTASSGRATAAKRGAGKQLPSKVTLSGKPVRSSGDAKRSNSRPKRGNTGAQQQQKPQRQQQQKQQQQQQQQPQQRPARTHTRKPANADSAARGLADTSTTFQDLGLPTQITTVLQQQGMRHPFPIQAAAIPQALEGKDILGRGPTGSGKTFTFGLPIIARLIGNASQPKRPRAVILVPTRELATQIRERLEPIANNAGQRVLEVVGGVKVARQITLLARPVDILIATPGRAQDLIDQQALDFSQVEIVALDEADQMADMGFLPQVRRLMDRMPKHAQHLLFSATLDGDVNVLVKRYMHNPITHSTGEATATVDKMDHILGVVPDKAARLEVVADLGRLGYRTVMFTRTKWFVDKLVKKLAQQGVHAVGLHGNKGQNTRQQALEDFRSGAVNILVATDIAARGIDVEDVALVVHVDPPAEHKAYVHRAGRTARAGNTGTVVTLTLEEAKEATLKMMGKAGVEPAEASNGAIAPMVQENIKRTGKPH